MADRPSTPHQSPTATARDVVSKILYLRQTYHFGPGPLTREALAAVREAAARPPVAGRREVSRADAGRTQKRFYQFTAIDDCTRVRVLKVHDACNQGTAIRFLDEVLRRLPFRVLVVQTDNGGSFSRAFTGTWQTSISATPTSAHGPRT